MPRGRPRRPKEAGRPDPPNPNWTKEQKQAYLLSSFPIFACHSGMLPKYKAKPHNEMCGVLQKYVPNPFDAHGKRGADVANRVTWHLDRETLQPAFDEFFTLDTRSLLYMAPRHSYKSSIMKAFLVYVLLLFRYVFHEEISTLYMRDSHQAAKEMLEEIKGDLQTCTPLLETFEDLSEEAHIWSSTTVNWSGKRDPSIGTAGVSMGRTGTHPIIIIMDDLVNDKNYTSPKKLANAWGAIIQFDGVMGPGAVRMVVGTPFTKNDCYAKIRKMNDEARARQQECRNNGDWKGYGENKPLWDEYIRAAWNQDGSMFFPDLLSEEYLEKKKRSLEEHGMGKLYSSWFLMTPTVEGEELFLPEYKQWGDFIYRAKPYPQLSRVDEYGTIGPAFPVNIYMRVDPAVVSKTGSHKHGVVVMATDADFNKYVLWGKSYRKTPAEVTKDLCELIARFEPPAVEFEREQCDPGMVSRVTEFIQEHTLDVRVNPIERGVTRGEKGLRIRALQPWYYTRTVWWQRGRACEDLQKEFDIYPDIEDGHADVLDAHSGLVLIAEPYKGDPHAEESNRYLRNLEALMEEVTEEEEFGDIARNWTKRVRRARTGARG